VLSLQLPWLRCYYCVVTAAQFEQLHLCMEKNKAVFDSLLQEMKDEEERNKAAAGASSSSGTDSAAAAAQQGESSATVPAGATTHQQQEQQATDGSSSSGQEGSGLTSGQAVEHAAAPLAAGSSMAAAS
jgi:hypothetical protein